MKHHYFHVVELLCEVLPQQRGANGADALSKTTVLQYYLTPSLLSSV